MSRALLQVFCLMSVIPMMILSDVETHDQPLIYCAVGIVVLSVCIQGAILYNIEPYFQNSCGSTFSTNVAITTGNHQMAIEFLWLNKSPSIEVEGHSLVVTATRADFFSIPLTRHIVSNGFDPNQTLYDDKTALMFFLESNHEEAVRYLFENCDVDVNVKDSTMRPEEGYGLIHYAIDCDLKLIKFMIETMKVPYYDSANIFFGTLETQLNDIRYEVFDYFIDELGLEYKKARHRTKAGMNILMYYITNTNPELVELDFIKYWIEKRGMDPWFKNDDPRKAVHGGKMMDFGKTIFDLIEPNDRFEFLNIYRKIDEKAHNYLMSLKESRESLNEITE